MPSVSPPSGTSSGLLLLVIWSVFYCDCCIKKVRFSERLSILLNSFMFQVKQGNGDNENLLRRRGGGLRACLSQKRGCLVYSPARGPDGSSAHSALRALALCVSPEQRPPQEVEDHCASWEGHAPVAEQTGKESLWWAVGPACGGGERPSPQGQEVTLASASRLLVAAPVPWVPLETPSGLSPQLPFCSDLPVRVSWQGGPRLVLYQPSFCLLWGWTFLDDVPHFLDGPGMVTSTFRTAAPPECRPVPLVWASVPWAYPRAASRSVVPAAASRTPSLWRLTGHSVNNRGLPSSSERRHSLCAGGGGFPRG
nr:uncharacterized protein LOC127488187 [Oryctolagus cuniculus]